MMARSRNSKMEPVFEEDEDAASSSAPDKSSCVSSGVSDFEEPGDMKMKIPALDKYNLRTKSIQNRIEVEKKRKNPRREPKPKQRPAPLSKYRRKTANLRERTRMQEINEAFEELRSVVPQLPEEEGPDADNKLTKITTLRLAVNYIAALTEILRDTEPPADGAKDPSSPPVALVHQSQPHSSSLSSSRAATQAQHILTSADVDMLANDHHNALHEQHGQHPLDALGLGLDLGLAGDEGDAGLLGDTGDLASDLEASFLLRQHISGHRPSSCASSDLAHSFSSPTTTETESLESFASGCGGWDFADTDSLDVPDTFDLILESEGEGADI